ncbi:hypothetical protein A8M32_00475 [Sinorhizobium alkalisoli]|uniref:Uncharacterized protein n=1 Tax=Sinorhizobium alkalisoli TaxID=1752398 RepID=A0A1E3VJ38_9HYPH|nr:hypothetical protein A8M32_00475 [Sinorhizobium alkalisoli]
METAVQRRTLALKGHELPAVIICPATATSPILGRKVPSFAIQLTILCLHNQQASLYLLA